MNKDEQKDRKIKIQKDRKIERRKYNEQDSEDIQTTANGLR